MNNIYDFLGNNSIYIVLFIVLAIWIGIFVYINNIDKKLKKIETELERESSDE